MSAVAEQLESILTGDVVIVGVGNRARGDDGLGPALVDRVRGHTSAKLVDAEEVPESYLGQIIACNPDAILLVDAVDFGGRPGEVGLFSSKGLPGRPAVSTHRVPLRLVMEYLEAETAARVMLLGVQPQIVSFGQDLSEPVRQAVDAVGDVVMRLLNARMTTECGSSPHATMVKERGL